MALQIDTSKSPHPNHGPFSASDLPIDAKGRIYHLQLKPEQIAKDILIVGDPERVPVIIGENFSAVEPEILHRGLRSITGEVKANGQRVSVITSGMGTPSLEIVFNELMALNEIDFETRIRNNMVDRLNIIRLGTSGVLQSDTILGTAIITSFAVGLDNTGLFYNVTPPDEVCLNLESKVKEMLDKVMDPTSRFYGKIFPYAAKGDPLLLEALVNSAQSLCLPYEVGVTLSSSGFNANQGRDIGRIPLSVPNIDRHLSELDLGLKGQRVANMEMEASQLLHFAGGHGYRGGVVCVGIANRAHDTFATNYMEDLLNATNIALGALSRMRN